MEKVQREVTMKTGKKLMAILIMATLLIPQSVYGADILSENVVGAQAVSDESRVSVNPDKAAAETIASEDAKEATESISSTTEDSSDKLSEDADAASDEAATAENDTASEADKTSEKTVSGKEDAADDNKNDSSVKDDAKKDAVKKDAVKKDDSETDSSLADSSVTDLAPLEEEKDEMEEVVGAGAPANDAKLETGVYCICMKQNYKNFLGSEGNVETHRANIQIVEKNYSKKQCWVITALGNGKYSIWNLSSGMALGIVGITPKQNANICQFRRHYKNVAQFYIRKTTDGAVVIQPVGGSFVLAATSADVKPGVDIRLTKYTAQMEAKWRCVKTTSMPAADATYTIRSKLDDSKYLSIEGAAKTSGANCILSGTSAGKYVTIYSTAADKCMIRPTCSNFTLNVYSNMQNGSNVKQYKITNSVRQFWKFNDEGNGYYSIRLASDTSMALDVAGGSAKEGANIQVYKFNGSDAQLFSLEKVDASRILPNGYYAMKSSANTKMAVEIANNSKSSGANVQLGTYNNRNKQKFYISYAGSGLYYIKNVRSLLNLDVAGASKANGTNVWQYTRNTTNAQKWKPVGSLGVFYLKSALGDIAMDCNAGSTAPGTNIQVYAINNTNAQKFRLAPVSISQEKEFTVAIDAGHQRHQNTGREPIGPGSSTMKQKVSSGTDGRYSGLSEYELNLQVSLKLQAELEKRGYNVFMVRTTHDVNISNAERAQMAANAGADIFIRIHANGADSSSVRGALNYMPSSSNPYLSSSVIAGSQRLARLVLDSYCAATGMPNLGLLTGDDMTGINWAKMPVTIVEMGFMSNRTDDLYMASASGQAQIVQGIANGVDKYFG